MGIASALGVLMLAALLPATTAVAETTTHKRQVKKPAQPSAYAAPRQDSGYREQLADKMRFGSSAWWEQMRREGRLGGETP